MRFTCEKNQLLQGLNIASRTVAVKSSLSLIEGILCRAGNGIFLTGYNMETGITYEIDADVKEPGECILPAKLFGDIVRRLPEGPVTVVVDPAFKVSIRAGFASFTISAEDAEDYPELPDVNDGRPIQIPQSKLKELISGTIFAVADNQARPIHNGVKFEVSDTAVTTVAVDGFRLARRTYHPEEGTFSSRWVQQPWSAACWRVISWIGAGWCPRAAPSSWLPTSAIWPRAWSVWD